ncbi:chloramphenicol phosphotransferase [Devosia geojensis]|uniref:Chloramphenicol phosphotransferase n=1 Tax=Devosia geojensis TaxID=443610 RepID=A0A0F5FTE4_9HYPH|nr:AAA family ATPase [Devosia geojensis]KKB11855.1 chloramphenicol phosphotransferase [Devosia geojensis]
MTAPGRIVVLNGPPRSGKSSIVAALQRTGPWINLGVDVYNKAMPPQLLPGIGLRPGGERPDLEENLPALYAALYETLAAHSRQGLDVVADLGHHDFYSRPLNLLPDCARRLTGLPALLVGVTAPIETILERRRANAKAGFYTVDEEIVRRWQEAVHTPGIYDLTVDTGKMTSEACAEAVLGALANPPLPRSFERLASGFSGRG